MTWLNPARWLLYLAAIGALLLALHRLDASRQQIGYDRAQAEYTAQALAAEQAARAKEQALQIQKQKVEAIYASHKKTAALAAAAADTELDRLRNELASATGPRASASAPAGSDAAPTGAGELLGACAQALVRLGADADKLAAQVLGLQAYAGQVCSAPQK